MRKLTALLMSLLSVSPAYATTEGNKVFYRFGVQGTTAYMLFTVNPTDGCANNALYFYINTDSGKALLSTALAAYSLGKPLTTVTYTKTSGQCWADHIEF